MVTALRARRAMAESGIIDLDEEDVNVIDCPYLTGPSDGLREALREYWGGDGGEGGGRGRGGVLFADICKSGPGGNILSSFIADLRSRGDLRARDRWDFVAAPRTYNPLGSTVTFLNEGDVVKGIERLMMMP